MHMFKCLKNSLMCISLSRVNGVNSDIIKCIADNNDVAFHTLKLIDCGQNFYMEDFNYLTARCTCLKVLVAFNCSDRFGNTNISVLECGAVLAIVNHGCKLVHSDLRHYKSKLGELEYFWLEAEGTDEDY